ncbi:MAG: hypothetical protein ACTS5Y_08085 [Pollutimonas bauzanensis]
MTRRDFQLIAATVAGVRTGYARARNTDLFYALDDTSRALADSLAGTNPRFDRRRFLDACGVQS